MIRVKHGAIAAAPHKRSSFECVLDKRGAHMLGDRPPHQAPGTAIDHCRHVQQLALSAWQVRDVADILGVGLGGGEISIEQARGRGVGGLGNRGAMLAA